MKTRYLVQAAIIAALYVAIAFVAAPISYGQFQLRISEALTVLPLFTPAAIPGLFVGCVLSNLLGGMGLPDIVLGSLATLAAAYATYRLRHQNKLVALSPPVFINALVVGTYLQMLFFKEVNVFAMMGWVALGQLGACYLIGYPLTVALERYKAVLFR